MRRGVAVGLAFTVVGCLPVGMGQLEAANDVGAEAPITEPPVVQSVVTVKEKDDSADPDVVVETAAAPAALPGRRPPDPVFFRMGAGYGALGRLDLASCRNEGLAPGYLRLRVTFHVSGRVLRAAVESASAPPSEALECIGEQLEAAWVPAFDGGEVTLSKSYFVN
ncbi:MAG TPA: hypothetical protein VKU41_11220 [Polyangiaceae bacterium]|nr:hypothetical protein [Polyangiaceae bacterium]